MKVMIFTLTLLACLPALGQEEALARGNSYYKNGAFDLAEAQYRKALPNPSAQFNLANALVRQHKYKDAIATLETLARNENEKLRAAAYYNSGVIYSRQKDLPASIEAYKSALRLAPDDKDIRENLQKALIEWRRQQESSKKQQKKPSSLNQKQANRQLERLQEKEARLRQRLQGPQKGSLPKDW